MRAGATGGSRVMPLTALAAQKRPNTPLSGQTPAGVTHARLGVSEARSWCYRCNTPPGGASDPVVGLVVGSYQGCSEGLHALAREVAEERASTEWRRMGARSEHEALGIFVHDVHRRWGSVFWRSWARVIRGRLPAIGRPNAEILHHGPPPAYARGQAAVGGAEPWLCYPSAVVPAPAAQVMRAVCIRVTTRAPPQCSQHTQASTASRRAGHAIRPRRAPTRASGAERTATAHARRLASRPGPADLAPGLADFRLDSRVVGPRVVRWKRPPPEAGLSQRSRRCCFS